MVNLKEKMYRRKRPAERGLTKLSYVHVAWSKITNGKKGSSNWLNKVGIKKTFNWLFFLRFTVDKHKEKSFPEIIDVMYRVFFSTFLKSRNAYQGDNSININSSLLKKRKGKQPLT